jgi:hypothetical protein
MKLLSAQHSSSFHCYIPLSSKLSPEYRILEHLNLSFPRNVGHQGSHTNTTGDYICVYIYMFFFNFYTYRCQAGRQKHQNSR